MKNWGLVVVAVVLVPIAMFTTTYGIYFATPQPNKHIVPFLSDTLDYAPGSCIGGLGLSISANLAVLAIVLKWRHVSQCIKLSSNGDKVPSLHRLNNGALVVGLIALVGLQGVGAFQYHVYRPGHVWFAFQYFASIVVYMGLITRLDHKIAYESRGILILRSVCCAGAVVFFFPFIVPLIFWPGQFTVLIIAATSEILLSLSTFVFLGSFYSELRFIDVTFEVDLLRGPRSSAYSGESEPLRETIAINQIKV
eukprot:TRINITY_DN7267_c0_g1_i2.p2 TRINITY_DN7267_c0_g1~~TRINITY_DN7267_c0_g1_i2.p2  ORF type:complete len:252 (-),score=78.26 TRINITY_DN7267_c0_g1_i2:1046-1801(-)